MKNPMRVLKGNGWFILTFLFSNKKELIEHFDAIAEGILSKNEESLMAVCVNKWDIYKFFKHNKNEKTNSEKAVYETIKPYMNEKFSIVLLVEGYEESILEHERTHALYELNKDFRKFVKKYVDERIVLKSRLIRGVKQYYQTDKLDDSRLYGEYAAQTVEEGEAHEIVDYYKKEMNLIEG